jgi:hypothetical protein
VPYPFPFRTHAPATARETLSALLRENAARRRPRKMPKVREKSSGPLSPLTPMILRLEDVGK